MGQSENRTRWLDGPPDDETLRAFVEAAVEVIALPLHGARPEVHEWVGRSIGQESANFTATVGALDAAHSVRLETVVWTRLTRSNARVLSELPSLLKARRVSLWVIEVAVTLDDGEPSGPSPHAQMTKSTKSVPMLSTAVVARFGLAIPSALAAMERARALGVEARIVGAPRCVLGRYADRALPSRPRTYAPVCEACPSRGCCPGVDAGYLDRFGSGELRQKPLVAPAPCALFERLRRHRRPGILRR